MASEPYLDPSSSPHMGTQLGRGEGKAHSHKEQKVCVAGSDLHPSAFCWLLCSLALVEGELKPGKASGENTGLPSVVVFSPF